MVDLEKIKRSVEGVCREIDLAFVKLSDRAGERAELNKQIVILEKEIVLLGERKAHITQSVRDEQFASSEKKKEYTNIKVKYRKLIDEEKIKHQKTLAESQAEVDSMREKALSLLRSEQLKIVNEIELSTHARDEVRKEYAEIKEVITKLKDGITI